MEGSGRGGEEQPPELHDPMNDLSLYGPDVEEFSIPAFANLENRKLDAELKRKESELIDIEAQYEENVERTKALKEHKKNVEQELQHTQNILASRQRELESEDHMKRLSEREVGRLKTQMARTEKESQELQDKLNVIQNSIFKGNQQMEVLKNQMNWDQKELERWMEATKQREEDTTTLEKYSKIDQGKIGQLMLNVEKLTSDVSKRRKQLETEMIETQAAQLELDKTATSFKKIHEERQQLIKLWENSIEQMQNRDKSILKAGERFAKLKAEAVQAKEQVKLKREFLEREVQNNVESERKIALADRNLAKFREKCRSKESAMRQFEDEVSAVKVTLGKYSSDYAAKQVEIQELKKALIEKNKKLETCRLQHAEAKERLHDVKNTTLSMEERAKQLEEFHQREEQRRQDMEKEMEELKDIHFKKMQELHKCREQEKTYLSEIRGAEAASKNLSAKIRKLDQEALKQQEIIYSQDYQIQFLQRKISRLQGERTDEERKYLNAKIEELTQTLEEQTSTNVLLTTQLKKLQDDVRQGKRKLEMGLKEKEQLAGKIDEMNLHNDSATRQLKAIVEEKEELMVEENIVKLELKRLRSILDSKADSMLNLETKQLNLKLAMDERKKEIEVHKSVLFEQKKINSKQCQNLNMELKERMMKVDRLKKRYELLMTMLAPEEGQQEVSQAYFVIKAAQEREELQRQGDKLDSDIRVTEKELRALENTLRLMNERNDQYRQSFTKADMHGKDAEKKLAVEEQLRAAMDRYKFKRKEIKELQEELQALESTLSNLTMDEEAHVQEVEDLEQTIQELENDIKEVSIRKETTSKEIGRLAQELRSSRGNPPDEETLEERYFGLLALKRFNETLHKNLCEIAADNPETQPLIKESFESVGIPFQQSQQLESFD